MNRGLGRVFKRGNVWWLQYSQRGIRKRESSGSTMRGDAVALLKRRHEEIRQGRPESEARKVRLSDLRAMIEADYALNTRRSFKRIAGAWSHLAAFFGEHAPAIAITGPRLAAYVNSRREEGVAAETLRNEISALRRGFRLARESGALLANEGPAAFPRVAPGSPRKGFIERVEHEAIRAALPPDEGDVAEFLFWSGWRRTEATNLRWSDIDELAGVLRIETTKTDEPRTLPYAALPALGELIRHRREITAAVQRQRGIVVSHVFHRNGEPIRTFFRAWAGACVKAGLGQEIRGTDRRLIRRIIARIPHDYRRSAARNLSRAGVPERVIMQLCGWKTRSVFDRYRVVAERDLAEGLARLAEAPPAAEALKVERIRKASQ